MANSQHSINMVVGVAKVGLYQVHQCKHIIITAGLPVHCLKISAHGQNIKWQNDAALNTLSQQTTLSTRKCACVFQEDIQVMIRSSVRVKDPKHLPIQKWIYVHRIQIVT